MPDLSKKNIFQQTAKCWDPFSSTGPQSSYRVPTTLDMQSLLDIARCKRDDAKYTVMSLREDPGCFYDASGDLDCHQEDSLLDTNAKVSDHYHTERHYNLLVPKLLRIHFSSWLLWEMIYECLEAKVSLENGAVASPPGEAKAKSDSMKP